MGYYVALKRKGSKSKIGDARAECLPRGGTYRIMDPGEKVTEDMLEFHVTYNYARYFHRALSFDEGKSTGLRALDGMKASDAMPAIAKGLGVLAAEEAEERKRPDDFEGNYDAFASNYWNACAANAAKALEGIMALARIAPDFTFTVE